MKIKRCLEKNIGLYNPNFFFEKRDQIFDEGTCKATNVKAVTPMARICNSKPIIMPIVAVTQREEAVVRPLADRAVLSERKMTPPARNPMPTTTFATMREEESEE